MINERQAPRSVLKWVAFEGDFQTCIQILHSIYVAKSCYDDDWRTFDENYLRFLKKYFVSFLKNGQNIFYVV